MKAIVNLSQRITLEIEEKDDMETMYKAIALIDSPKYCNICQKSKDFTFVSNKDKEGNIYINVKCTCGAKAKLGQLKAGGYFWHKFTQYMGKINETIKKI